MEIGGRVIGTSGLMPGDPLASIGHGQQKFCTFPYKRPIKISFQSSPVWWSGLRPVGCLDEVCFLENRKLQGYVFHGRIL